MEVSKACTRPRVGRRITTFAGFLAALGRSATVQLTRSIHFGPDQNTMANRLDSAVYQRYMDLPTSGRVMATYIWIDGTGEVSCPHNKAFCWLMVFTVALSDVVSSWLYSD